MSRAHPAPFWTPWLRREGVRRVRLYCGVISAGDRFEWGLVPCEVGILRHVPNAEALIGNRRALDAMNERVRLQLIRAPRAEAALTISKRRNPYDGVTRFYIHEASEDDFENFGRFTKEGCAAFGLPAVAASYKVLGFERWEA